MSRVGPAGVAFALLLVPGCVEIFDGNGMPAEETRAVSDFDAIATQGGLDVEISRGDAFAVTVRIDQNLLEHIGTRVSGDTLKIAVKGGNLGDYLPGPHVIISMPRLTSAELRGAGSLTATGFDERVAVSLSLLGAGSLSWSGTATDLDASLQGAGELSLDGQADRATYYLRGAGTLDGRDLIAQEADIDVDGVGTVSATVDGIVDARAGGTSSIELFGAVQRGAWSTTDTATINGSLIGLPPY